MQIDRCNTRGLKKKSAQTQVSTKNYIWSNKKNIMVMLKVQDALYIMFE